MARPSTWRNSASLNNFKVLNSGKKEAKASSVTQRVVIQCAVTQAFSSSLPSCGPGHEAISLLISREEEKGKEGGS